MTDIVHMRNDVIESITNGNQICFQYKAEGGIITNRTVSPVKFYSDFTGFTGYDTDKKEDRNFRFERVEEWKGLYGDDREWEIEIHRQGEQLESYNVVADTEEEAIELFKSGEYNFNFDHGFAAHNEPEDEDIQNIEEI